VNIGSPLGSGKLHGKRGGLMSSVDGSDNRNLSPFQVERELHNLVRSFDANSPRKGVPRPMNRRIPGPKPDPTVDLGSILGWHSWSGQSTAETRWDSVPPVLRGRKSRVWGNLWRSLYLSSWCSQILLRMTPLASGQPQLEPAITRLRKVW